MNRGKKPSSLITNLNSLIYMDLKDIIRKNALPFLPAKSLGRYMSVCREWKLQISSPFFAHNQSNCFRDISGFFLQSPTGTITFVSLDPVSFGIPDPRLEFLPEPVAIRSASNGLLCCRGYTGDRAYYICNPVTQKWKKLPNPCADHGCDPAIVLVFEPSLLNFVADYKLVCAFKSDLGGYEFEIYSSLEESWKISGEICFGSWQILPRTGVHAGGIVYWRSTAYNLVAFDLRSERTTFVADAHGYSPREFTPLGQVNGKLCAASLDSFQSLNALNLTIYKLSNPYTNTMQMNSHAHAWVMNQQINLHDFVANWEPPLTDGSVEFVGGDVVVIRSGRILYSYNMKTKVITRLAPEVATGQRMFPYVNNLVEI